MDSGGWVSLPLEGGIERHTSGTSRRRIETAQDYTRADALQPQIKAPRGPGVWRASDAPLACLYQSAWGLCNPSRRNPRPPVFAGVCGVLQCSTRATSPDSSLALPGRMGCRSPEWPCG